MNPTPNTDAPKDDAPNAIGDDDAYPYFLRNHKNNKERLPALMPPTMMPPMLMIMMLFQPTP